MTYVRETKSMTLDQLGKPFQGTVWYWVESTYGGGASGTTLAVSCKVQNVRIETGDRHKVLRDIGSPLACHLLAQTHEPKFHIEYIPQDDDTLMDDVIDRSSATLCTLQSLAFCVGFNIHEAADNISYYDIVGFKPATIRIAGSKNTEYLVTIDGEVKSIATDVTPTGTAPTALTGDYLAFNVAGEITKTGGHVVDTDHIAFITNSVEVTITHKLTGYTDHDSLYKSFLIEGEMNVEGSVDITLDGGGALHVAEVLANTEFDLQIDMGEGAGSPRLNLENCQWKSTSIDGNISGEAITSSVPFTAKPTACTGIMTTIPA
jgi:hypothetical protein